MNNIKVYDNTVIKHDDSTVIENTITVTQDWCDNVQKIMNQQHRKIKMAEAILNLNPLKQRNTLNKIYSNLLNLGVEVKL